MAEMIPDRLPSAASAGEKRVFELLQKLPDDCLVYYEPKVSERHPDFVVVMPPVGVLVIEVKGWYAAHIVRADTNEVEVTVRGQTSMAKHPIRQARDYMFRLMDYARRHHTSRGLLQSEGPYRGRFSFPFGHMAVLNNIRQDNLSDIPNSGAVFPATKVVTRDRLEALSDLPRSELINTLKSYFDPWWTFVPLNEGQISIIRAIIHPEIVVSKVSQDQDHESLLLKVLDLRQERHARSIGDGHRIVYGVAGSGKTVLLIARTRVLAERDKKRILVLCFNRALADHFKGVLATLENVVALNFHAWGSRNGIRFQPNEDDDEFGQRLLDRLSVGMGEAGRYDAVFIDEAQDFARTWFLCAKQALREPEDGDLLIVGDGGQSLYRRRPFTWTDAGIHARGRTINTRFDLDINYRNTRQFLRIAAPFAVQTNGEDEAATLSISVDEETAVRQGLMPKMITAANRTGECNRALNEILDWLENGVPDLGGQRSQISPSEIGVLYPRIVRSDRTTMRIFVDKLRAHVPVSYQGDPPGAMKQADALTVQTIHSSKGLQYRAVIILWADLLPWDVIGDEQESLDRGLMYVGLTRAEDILVLTRSRGSKFTRIVEKVLALPVHQTA
jgi:superfamily I DNA/RNA helicase